MLAVVSAGAVLLDDVPVWSGLADGAVAAPAQDAVYFARYQSDSQARVEIWKSAGTAAGTVKLLTARGISGTATTTGAAASVRDFAVTANGNLYFSDAARSPVRPARRCFVLCLASTRRNGPRAVPSALRASTAPAHRAGTHAIPERVTPRPNHVT